MLIDVTKIGNNYQVTPDVTGVKAYALDASGVPTDEECEATKTIAIMSDNIGFAIINGSSGANRYEATWTSNKEHIHVNDFGSGTDYYYKEIVLS